MVVRYHGNEMQIYFRQRKQDMSSDGHCKCISDDRMFFIFGGVAIRLPRSSILLPFQIQAVFIIFPKSRNTFQYLLYQNAYANAFRNNFLQLLRLSSNSIASTSREEGLVTAQLHCAVLPVEQISCRAQALIQVGRRYKGISKQLCVYHLYRNVFLAQTRIRSHFFRRF